MTCIFCQIREGKIPAEVVYEDDEVLAFRDIHPEAPVHVLVIPKKHIESLADTGPGDRDLLGRLMEVAREVAVREKVDGSGYRVLTNCREDGGQVVGHLHLHLLGGRKMGKLG